MAIKYGVDYGPQSQAFGVDLNSFQTVDDLAYFDDAMTYFKNRASKEYDRMTGVLKRMAAGSGRYTYDASRGVLVYNAGRAPQGLAGMFARNSSYGYQGRMETRYDKPTRSPIFGFMGQGGFGASPFGYQAPQPKKKHLYGDWRDAWNTSMIQSSGKKGLWFKSRGGKGGWGHGWEGLVKGYGDRWETMSADEKWEAVRKQAEGLGGYYSKKRGFMNKLKNFGGGVLGAVSKVLSNPVAGLAIGVATAGAGLAAGSAIKGAGAIATKAATGSLLSAGGLASTAGSLLAKQAGKFALKSLGDIATSTIGNTSISDAGRIASNVAGSSSSTSSLTTAPQAAGDNMSLLDSFQDAFKTFDQASDIATKAWDTYQAYQENQVTKDAAKTSSTLQERTGLTSGMISQAQGNLSGLMKGQMSPAYDQFIADEEERLKRILVAQGHNPATSGFGAKEITQNMGMLKAQLLQQEQNFYGNLLNDSFDQASSQFQTTTNLQRTAAAGTSDTLAKAGSTIGSVVQNAGQIYDTGKKLVDLFNIF